MSDHKQTDWANEKLCFVCSALLSINVTGRPSGYCSNACKMKDYRRRSKALRNLEETIKPLRNSKKASKPLRNSKKASKPLLKSGSIEKIIGVSGTVHKLPIISKTADYQPSPVIRDFKTLKAFFDGSDSFVTKESPLTITSGLLAHGEQNHD